LGENADETVGNERQQMQKTHVKGFAIHIGITGCSHLERSASVGEMGTAEEKKKETKTFVVAS